jgi:hypothetical protein
LRLFLQNRKLQHTVSDDTDLFHVRQLIGQVVVCVEPTLGFEDYLARLLSACYIYDKRLVTPQSAQGNVYSTTFEHDDDFYDAKYGTAFGVDSNVSDLLAYVTDLKPPGSSVAPRPHKSSFIPCDEWLKLAFGRTTNGHLQHRLPTRHDNAHEVHCVVNLDDLFVYSTNEHISTGN